MGRSRRPHLVGVAGTGMSSLATLLVGMGKAVSGSDLGSVETLKKLAGRGVRTYSNHAADHLTEADLLIRSAAIPADNVELSEAQRRGLTVLTHAEALGELMAGRRGIGVAGTHGKSTTTALIAHLLEVAGRDPTLVGGAESIDFGDSSKLGNGRELVAEADEFDRRFLHLHPEIAVITGIERDHLDYYRDLAEIQQAFAMFVDGMPRDGVVVTAADDPNLEQLPLSRERMRYGESEGADWRLTRFEPILGGGCRFVTIDPKREARSYETQMTGRHNAHNGLAALAVADVVGVSRDDAARGLASFRGTRRRFETKLKCSETWVVDDYAHHPTAIAAMLRAAREVHRGPIWAIFQPHTSSRTSALLPELTLAFADADHVIVTPIYQPAGREPENGIDVTSADLVARMRHPDARAVDSLEAAVEGARPALTGGAMVLVMGAGDVTTVAERLASLGRAE